MCREAVRNEMQLQDSEGFSVREPSAKKVRRGVLISLGPHHEWSGDGHDKLSKIGFPIWGVRDKWSGKWLGLWVIPNNRLMLAIAYLYLSLVAELGGKSCRGFIRCIVLLMCQVGMPMQSTTDCGSETTLIYGMACSLRYVVMIHPAISFNSSLSVNFLPLNWMLQVLVLLMSF